MEVWLWLMVVCLPIGYQKRTINCVRKTRTQEHIVRTAMCVGQIKPNVERKCKLPACER